MAGKHLLASGLGRRLAAVQLCAALAQMIGAFLLPWVALERSGQASISALVAALSFAGLIFAGLPISSWVDRTPRTRALHLLALGMILSSLVTLALLLLTKDAWAVWPLLISQAVITALAAGINASCNSIVKLSFDESSVTSAGAFLSTLRQMSWFGGQALGAIAVAVSGPDLAAIIGLAGAVLTAGLIWTLRPVGQASERRRLTQDIRQLLRAPGLMPILLIGGSWNFLVAPIFTSQVAFLHQVGSLSSGYIGIVYALGACGSAAAIWPLHVICRRSQPTRYISPLLLAWSLAALLYIALTQTGPPLALVGWGVVMLANTNLAGLFSGLRADLNPPEMMGLGTTIMGATHMLFFMLGGICGSLLLHWLSLTTLNIAFALSLIVLIPLALAASQRIRQSTAS